MGISIWISLLALVVSYPPDISGYVLQDDQIIFRYYSSEANTDVYVCGNFMGWKKDHPDWKMTKQSNGVYVLKKPVATIKTQDRTFYEFTFSVAGQLVDADRRADHVIHCAGYGYRYVIHWKN